MGRPLIPPENVREAFKCRAQKKIIAELTREAIEEDTTRQQLVESILVAHVEKRIRARTAAATKKVKTTKQRAAKRS
jgi:hypothetical protein